MDKYCARCGRPLPEGVEKCPDCGSTVRANDAALFTKITQETEVWQTPEKVRPEMPKHWKRRIVMGVGALAAAALIAGAVVWFQPVNRVVRALDAGQYTQAMTLYQGNERLATGANRTRIETAIGRAAASVCDAYEANTMDAEEAANALGLLNGLAGDDALLETAYIRFRGQLETEATRNLAVELVDNGDYLAARAQYLQVPEDDPAYAEAQELAEQCLALYTDSILTQADRLIQRKDYANAVRILEEGKQALLELEAFNQKMEYKLNATRELLETQILADAAALAQQQEYRAAVELLRENITAFGLTSEGLGEIAASYEQMEQAQTLNGWAERASALYDSGDAAGAFALLEGLKTSGNAPLEEVQALLTSMERRYAEDTLSTAREVFAGNRDNLSEAIAILTKALAVRELPELQVYQATLKSYLPVSLTELEYAEKYGDVFRSTETFETVGGEKLDGGWIWGEDSAMLIFTPGTDYDRFTATLAVRRDDSFKASGHFELFLDGELAYESPVVTHPSSDPVSIDLDISGCSGLTIRFVNDYTVSSTESGYCYHGLVNPLLTKTIPEAEQFP